MYAITLRSHWAHAVAYGIPHPTVPGSIDVGVATHRPFCNRWQLPAGLHGQRIAIHAGARGPTPKEWGEVGACIPASPETVPLSAIVAVATVWARGDETHACAQWVVEQNPYWGIGAVVALDRPVPCISGGMSWWQLTDAAAQAVQAAVGRGR
jgi:hypothetical protein